MCIRDSKGLEVDGEEIDLGLVGEVTEVRPEAVIDLINAGRCLLYTSDAADERSSGDLGGRRIL